jgi:hydrogenase maturation protease
VLVVGVGNELRGDDGAGLAVVRRLAQSGGVEVHELHGEPLGLLDTLPSRDALLLVDTMRSGAAPGTIRRFDVSDTPLPVEARTSSSTHALGLHDALELARSLDRLPPRAIVYAVEGERFEAGHGLSGAVASAVPKLAAIVHREAMAHPT